MVHISSATVKEQFEISVAGKQYQHQTNADSSSIRVCNTDTKRPFAGLRLEKGQVYALLASYAGGEATYYENAVVAGAYDSQTGETIPVETEKWGAGIYTRTHQL